MHLANSELQQTMLKAKVRRITLLGVAMVCVAGAALAFFVLLAVSLILLVPGAVIAAALESGTLMFFQDLLSETLASGGIVSAYILLPWLLFCLFFGAIGISRLVRTVAQDQSSATPAAPGVLGRRLKSKIIVWSGLIGAPLAVAFFLGFVYYLMLASILSSSGFPDPWGFVAKSLLTAIGLDVLAILAGWLICRWLVCLMYQDRSLPRTLVNALCFGAALFLTLPIFWSAMHYVAPSAAQSAASLLPNFGPRTDDSAPRVLYQKPNGGEGWYFGEIIKSNEQRVLHNYTDVIVSPTGKALAFSDYCGSPAGSCILISDMDGRNMRRLEGVKGEPEGWSPDGCKIVGINYETLFVVNRDGSNYREIATGTFPEWMPDGQSIVYRNHENEMHVVRVDGTSDKQLVTGEAFLVDVSPDGKHISYLRQPSSVIYVLDLENGTSTEIGRGTDQAWSPDGERLIYADETPFKSMPTLTIVNKDGSAPIVLPVKGRNPEWSPDGMMIVYDTYGLDDPSVNVVKADGSGARTINQGYFPNWVPMPNERTCN